MRRLNSRSALATLLALCLVVASAAPAFAATKRVHTRAVRPMGLHRALSEGANPTPNDTWDTADDTPVGARDLLFSGAEVHNLVYASGAPLFYDYDFFVATMKAGHVYRIQANENDGSWGSADPMIDVYTKSEADAASLGTTGSPDYLYDWPSRVEVDNSRYLPGGTSDGSSQVIFSPTVDGQYYVVVQEGWFSIGGGQYEIQCVDLGTVPPGKVSRMDGMAGYYRSDRYSVAAALADEVGVSQDATHPANVIIACGDDRAAADPLSAGSLSGLLNAPILLVSATMPTKVPAPTASYLYKLKRAGAGPVRFSIVGGAASVPESLKRVLLSFSPPGSKFVARYAGSDRYAVGVNIATKIRSVTGTAPVCFVANGENSAVFYDALAASALAAHQRYPILLTRARSVPPSTLAASKLYTKRVIVGNTVNVQRVAYNTLKGTVRVGYDYAIYGTYDRQYMARLISDYGASQQWVGNSTVGLANKLADSLVGGAAMGRMGGSLLFTDDSWMDAEFTEGLVDQLRASSAHAYVVGGVVSVRPPVITRLQELLGITG